MSMTYEQFIKYAVDLKKHSDSIDDDWNFCEYQNPMNGSFIKYLVKRKMQRIKKLEHSDFQFEEDISIMCEYNILYNPSYSCPDMYFNMWYTDGKLLSLECIYSLIHYSFGSNLIQEKWNFMTQQQHPLKNTPFFRIHPCQSAHILNALGFSLKKKFNPLITWLSSISPFIGLKLHLSYGYTNSNIEKNIYIQCTKNNKLYFYYLIKQSSQYCNYCIFEHVCDPGIRYDNI